MTRHNPTDHQCLRAAEQALAEHRATRPATPSEAREIAERHRAMEAAYLAQAAEQRNPTPPEWTHGPTTISDKHAWARAASQGLRLAGDLERLALRESMSAEAWERIADRPDLAWLATEAEYLARVEYYRGRIEARRGSSQEPARDR